MHLIWNQNWIVNPHKRPSSAAHIIEDRNGDWIMIIEPQRPKAIKLGEFSKQPRSSGLTVLGLVVAINLHLVTTTTRDEAHPKSVQLRLKSKQSRSGMPITMTSLPFYSDHMVSILYSQMYSKTRCQMSIVAFCCLQWSIEIPIQEKPIMAGMETELGGDREVFFEKFCWIQFLTKQFISMQLSLRISELQFPLPKYTIASIDLQPEWVALFSESLTVWRTWSFCSVHLIDGWIYSAWWWQNKWSAWQAS